ncbi:hypothetical protein EniLVp02_0252 [Vibrio phage EniLVp02]
MIATIISGMAYTLGMFMIIMFVLLPGALHFKLLPQWCAVVLIGLAGTVIASLSSILLAFSVGIFSFI